MTWEYDVCFLEYTEASQFLKTSLGISQLDHDLDRKVLLPYYNMLIKYLNKKLIELGSDDIKAKVQLVLDTYDYCADRICAGPLIGVENPETGTQLLAKEILGEDGFMSENYDQDRFVFAMADALSSLRLRLKFQYIYLWEQEPDDGECCRCGMKGETEEDYESWVSGVNPEDELYDRANYTRSNSAWQVSKDRICDCYRHSSEEN